MAKFYVESGNVQWIVTAKTRRGAALWSLHRTLSQVMPFLSGAEDDDGLDSDESCEHTPRLSGEVTVSERGFGGEDAETYDAFELLTEWNQLLNALAKLQTEDAA